MIIKNAKMRHVLAVHCLRHCERVSVVSSEIKIRRVWLERRLSGDGIDVEAGAWSRRVKLCSDWIENIVVGKENAFVLCIQCCSATTRKRIRQNY